MNAEALAIALNELVTRELGDAARLAIAGRPAGLLVSRTDLVAFLQAAVPLLRAFATGQCSVPIFPGDDVDVRCRVIEHQGDCIVVEHPSLRGRERSVVGPTSISKVYPVASPDIKATRGR